MQFLLLLAVALMAASSAFQGSLSVLANSRGATSSSATMLSSLESPANTLLVENDADDASSHNSMMGRRQLFQGAAAASASAASMLLFPAEPATAEVKVTGPDDFDLPPDALRSYLQYRIGLQIFADFYVFDLQRSLASTDEWGEVGQLFRVNNNRGQGQPSRIEREFTNPVRILGLSFPPEYADPMRDSQFKFEKAMATISKVTAGIRRDLPVEIDKNAVGDAKKGWEDGRVAINEFFAILNEATGLPEMKPIPPPGPDQVKEYGRSPGRYYNLVKKTKLCQNRGGPALSQAWGQLMVSGYLQDSCGIPDINEYFYQS